MTLYGFLATLIICIAVVGIVCLLQRRPLLIHIKHDTQNTEIYQSPEPKDDLHFGIKPPVAEPIEPEQKTEVVEPKGMDAVIQAVNEIMGIGDINDNKTK